MKVRLLRVVCGPMGSFKPGDEPDLDEKLARALIADGAAAMPGIAPDLGNISPPETAAIEPPEKAIRRRGRPRGLTADES